MNFKDEFDGSGGSIEELEARTLQDILAYGGIFGREDQELFEYINLSSIGAEK